MGACAVRRPTLPTAKITGLHADLHSYTRPVAMMEEEVELKRTWKVNFTPQKWSVFQSTQLKIYFEGESFMCCSRLYLYIFGGKKNGKAFMTEMKSSSKKSNSQY